ncbi:MAG TPA: DUF4157 domain-containing protein [Candidatus Angelobacter sp.]|nr:DUF4157 domain-containing protein [Candidatus Angelobacter sp.]
MYAPLQKQNKAAGKTSSQGLARANRQPANQPEHLTANLQDSRENQTATKIAHPSRGGTGVQPTGGGNHFRHNFADIPVFHRPVRGIQAKLTVNVPGDAYEQEADRVAEQVMRMTEPQAAPISQVSGRAAGVQRECACGGTCDDCKKKNHDEEHAKVQMKAAGPVNAGGMEAPPIVHEVLRSSGQPLDARTRAFMEPRFGHDFSKVRVHTDEKAVESAKAVGARAYTVGSNVVFGAGEFVPGSRAGKRLLGHELAHVVQQGAFNPKSGALVESRLQRQPGSDPPVPPAGGNILYIGMSKNAALEATSLQTAYHGKPVTVTAVTLSDTESKTKTIATGSATFDLTSDDGIKKFVAALPLSDKQQVESVTEILKKAPNVSRDDWAHVIAVYAQTESDGKDRMSRVILSGHSGGQSIYSKENKGEIEFSILAGLSAIFLSAAAQTKHLMVAACFAGDEDILLQYYQKAFPNLKTFAGWTFFSPTDAQGAKEVTGWSHTTDVDPATLPAPKTGEATWEQGTYHGANPKESPADTIASLKLQEQTVFDDYFTGAKVSQDFTGEVPVYYQRALAAANRRDITGSDHDYAQTQANRAFRIRKWKQQAAGFWGKYKTTIQKGYGTAKAPDYAHLSRKAALDQIAAFPSSANGTAADQAEAQRLLNALGDLSDPNIMDKTWQ